MKKIVAICAAILMTAIVFAQAPNKMSYQAVIRNTANALVANQAVGIRISVLQTSPNGSAVYVETQTPTTNANGLASIEIGGGVVVSGSFSSIDWANGPYFVKTETDPTGGTSYSITATSQLLSVPYALYAQYSSTSSSREIQIFNSSGTFVVPNSVTKVIVEIWGAGGGGGGGGGFNPVGVMTGLAIGGAMGGQMAGMMNHLGQGMQQPMMTPPPIPQVAWHVSINGQPAGPFNPVQLQELVRNGQLTPQIHVWKAGMANWELAGNIPELAMLFAPPAPPPPPPPPVG